MDAEGIDISQLKSKELSQVEKADLTMLTPNLDPPLTPRLTQPTPNLSNEAGKDNEEKVGATSLLTVPNINQLRVAAYKAGDRS